MIINGWFNFIIILITYSNYSRNNSSADRFTKRITSQPWWCVFYFENMKNDLHCLSPVLRFVPHRNYNNDVFYKINPMCCFNNSFNAYESGRAYFIKVKNIIDSFGKDFYIDTCNRLRAEGAELFEVPCRKCINCQLRNSREWTIRNTLELKNYEDRALFITLTYSDSGLVYSRTNGQVATLYYEDVQYFFKRLRKQFDKKEIRFYLAQEYGSISLRPHYHIILYGLDFNDLQFDDFKVNLYKNNENGQPLYQSDFLDSIWYRHNDKNKTLLGMITVGAVSPESISYVAHYCTKKIDFKNYELMGVEPQKNVMSRKRGIGFDYFDQKKDSIYNLDSFIYHNNNMSYVLKPLKYFDRLYDKNNTEEFVVIKDRRISNFDFLDWYKNLDTNINLAEYMENLEKFKRRKYFRKEVN